jgi:hypothetical protein
MPAAAQHDPLAIAWEQDSPGVVQRYLLTVRQLLGSAPRFFFSLDDAPSQRAERFAYLSSLVGLMGYFAVQLWFYKDRSELARLVEIIARSTERPVRPDGVRTLFVWGLLCSPVLAALPAHMAAGMYQLGLWFFRVNQRSYDVTFRVVAYGLAPMLLFAVPGVGPLIAPGWIFALHWTGIAAAHRIPLLVSALVVLMPILSVGLLLLRGSGLLLLLFLTR